MKKRCVLFLLSLLLLLLLAGCSKQELANDNNEYDIKIESPVVFSHNGVEAADGSIAFVNIEMISGQYSFDEYAGAFWGNNWIGEYQIRVYIDEFDLKSTVYLAPFSINDNQPMNFKGEFSLVFDDYNNDGSPDFTLGQYHSGNGYEYALFSITKAGEVEKLDTDGLMFISERDYSIKLEKLSPTSFKKSAYDNSVGKTTERIYQWKDNKFMSAD